MPLPTGPHALEQIRIDAVTMGVDLTSFSDDQIHASYYKVQSARGLDTEATYADLVSSIRDYAVGIER